MLLGWPPCSDVNSRSKQDLVRRPARLAGPALILVVGGREVVLRGYSVTFSFLFQNTEVCRKNCVVFDAYVFLT
jgi:hypothetical protein